MKTKSYNVILVDDDQDVLDAYQHLMTISNLRGRTIADPNLVSDLLDKSWQGVVVLDMYMPQKHGLEVLQEIKAIDDGIPVIVVTGHGDIPMAVDAMKLGACEFLEKPVEPSRLLELIKRYSQVREQQVENLKQVFSTIDKALVGQSAQSKTLKQDIAKLGLVDCHITLWGESGTTRHDIASLIHQSSKDSRELVFLDIAQSGDIDGLLDALKQQRPSFWVVDGLEVLSEEKQRLLADGLIRQSRLNLHCVRVVTVLETDPQFYLSEHVLLPELYYVLSQGTVKVPSLRDRPDDIAALFHYYLKLSCKKLSKVVPKVDSGYLQVLRNYTWPGNVRELRNVAELYAIGIVKLTGRDRVITQDNQNTPLDTLIDSYERQLIEDALFLHSGKVTEAASYLQVPRKKLYLRMKKHNIDKDAYKSR